MAANWRSSVVPWLNSMVQHSKEITMPNAKFTARNWQALLVVMFAGCMHHPLATWQSATTSLLAKVDAAKLLVATGSTREEAEAASGEAQAPPFRPAGVTYRYPLIGSGLSPRQ